MVQSSVIKNTQKNPNFDEPLFFFDTVRTGSGHNECYYYYYIACYFEQFLKGVSLRMARQETVKLNLFVLFPRNRYRLSLLRSCFFISHLIKVCLGVKVILKKRKIVIT